MARRGRFQPLGALLWFAAGAAAQTCASVAFAERIVTTLQDGAHSVFAIDVDGDGDLDALSASTNDDTVAWYDNDGSQSFAERVITDSADNAGSVFAIDVDGDGDVDALSASYMDDTVACYENDGSQSFTERVITDSADGARSVYAADVDGDGDVDALSATFVGDDVEWYESGPAEACSCDVTLGGADCNSLAQVQTYCDGTVDGSYWCLDDPSSSGVAAYGSGGSWDCATLELACVAHDDAYDSGATFYGGSEDCGASVFDFAAHVISAAADAAHSVFAIDVDGDGDVDALSASGVDDTVAWYENDGSQSFTQRVITALADGARSVFAIDVDGDGDVDALSASQLDDTVAWYENDGTES
jgi:oligoribonuclease NrnB/cAMP/cGMP phosphodiesterase (DHH superfamily)